jgi:transmembrane sensor
VPHSDVLRGVAVSEEQGRGPYLSRIEHEAIAWVQKLASGKATAEDIAGAERWRAQNPLHARAYDNAEQVWQRMAVVGRARYGRDADFMASLQAFGRRRAAMTRRAMLGASAVAIGGTAVYGALKPPLGLWPSLSELGADYRTGTGEQRTIAFAGDVQIALNTQTSLTIRPATDVEDRVELIAGEASFATQSRAARALAVFAAGGKTVSESGRFDVRCLGAGARVSVTCFEGQLKVENGQNIAELQPRQRVHYDGAGLSETGMIDPNIESEWRRGIVTFRDAPLAEAVEEMNRYRPGRIILRNPTLGQRLLSGRFRIDQMDRALLQVEHTFNASVKRLPGGIVLLS